MVDTHKKKYWFYLVIFNRFQTVKGKNMKQTENIASEHGLMRRHVLEPAVIAGINFAVSTVLIHRGSCSRSLLADSWIRQSCIFSLALLCSIGKICH